MRYLDGEGSICNKCKHFCFMAPANSPDGRSFTCYECRGGKSVDSFIVNVKEESTCIITSNDIDRVKEWWNDFIAEPSKVFGIKLIMGYTGHGTFAFYKKMLKERKVHPVNVFIFQKIMEKIMTDEGTLSMFYNQGGWGNI